MLPMYFPFFSGQRCKSFTRSIRRQLFRAWHLHSCRGKVRAQFLRYQHGLCLATAFSGDGTFSLLCTPKKSSTQCEGSGMDLFWRCVRKMLQDQSKAFPLRLLRVCSAWQLHFHQRRRAAVLCSQRMRREAAKTWFAWQECRASEHLFVETGTLSNSLCRFCVILFACMNDLSIFPSLSLSLSLHEHVESSIHQR